MELLLTCIPVERRGNEKVLVPPVEYRCLGTEKWDTGVSLQLVPC